MDMVMDQYEGQDCGGSGGDGRVVRIVASLDGSTFMYTFLPGQQEEAKEAVKRHSAAGLMHPYFALMLINWIGKEEDDGP